MITELTLHIWKSFADATLYIDPLTFIIGTNASGKSNILDAQDFLKKIASRIPIDEAAHAIRGGKDWVIRKGTEDFSIKVKIQNGSTYFYTIAVERKNGAYELKTEVLSEVLLDGSLCTIFTSEWQTVNDSGLAYLTKLSGDMWVSFSDEDQNFSAAISAVSIFPLSKEDKEAVNTVVRNLKNIFILNPIPASMRSYVPVSDVLKSDASNLAGMIAGLDDKTKFEVEQALTAYIKPLPERDVIRIWAEKVGLKDSDAMLYCEENWNGTPLQLDARGMSDGTLRFIAIVIALLTGVENSLLIVEEVDNGLHSSRSEELLRVLHELGTKRSIDVICTTHNPVLIDTLGNAMVPFISYVKRNSSGDSEILLLEEKENLAKLMAGNSLGGLMIM